MSETGQSWQHKFAAEAAQARPAREWVATHLTHPDSRLLAAELFNAVLATSPDAITMTVSTAGQRTRISATGTRDLPLRSTHGPGFRITSELAARRGTTPDHRGLWAEVEEAPCPATPPAPRLTRG